MAIRQVLRAECVDGSSVMAVGRAAKAGLRARLLSRIYYSADGAVTAVDGCNGKNSAVLRPSTESDNEQNKAARDSRDRQHF